MYVTAEEYKKLSCNASIPDDELDSAIAAAERDIDGMTYNRIRGIGIDNLTEFQQEIVKQATVDQMDWRRQYGSLLTNPLTSYGINGVSMSWDSSKVKQVGGVYTSTTIASMLMQTGLMCGRLS